MIPSMASMSSSSSATVRVEKATSEFLIGPDWTLNMDICDTVNSNQMLAKDAVKAVKKRLQHKNPKVQLLALTLLETMVKNCGDSVHFQIADRNILPEMVKIVKKKTDMHVRDKVLTLIGSWSEAFGASGGKYPQYYMAYEELRRFGVQFPRHSPDAAPIFTPPVTHSAPRHPQPGYGMPSSSSTRLDEAMAAEDSLSLSSINSMRNFLDLLTDMLQAVDPSDRSAIKNEVIIDLVEQCRMNQRKLVQLLGTTGDEELLGQGLELNDSLQTMLAKYDAIASGSPLPPALANTTIGASESHDSSLGPGEVIAPSPTSSHTPSHDVPTAPVLPAQRGMIDEEDDEEDDFAQLARRHSEPQTEAPHIAPSAKSDAAAPSEALSSPAMSNALVPVNPPASVSSKDQDIIDLLSLTLTSTSTEQTSQTFNPTVHTPMQDSSTSPGITFSSEGHPSSNGIALNNYIAPWAHPEPPLDPRFQPQPQQHHQPQTLYTPQPQHGQPEIQPQPQPQPELHPPQQPERPSDPRFQPQPQPQPQQYHQPQTLYTSQPQQYSRPEIQPHPGLHPQPQFPQYAPSSYPPPPWAATPGYFSNHYAVTRPTYTYATPRPTSLSNTRPVNGEAHVNSGAGNAGQKPFIPSYRLFEDLDVFGNADGKFKYTGNASPSLSGSNNQSMLGGRK